MNVHRWFSVLLALGLALVPAARAQDSHETPQLTATLMADTTAVQAGKAFTAGVRVTIQPEWYVYWRFVGDIGLPTSVVWELPPGWKAGELQWPLPVSHEAAGDFLNYVYENEVLLFAEITPPAALPPGPVTLKAKVAWQVCNPRSCVPGDAALALELPTGPASPANAELFAGFRAQLPRESGAPFAVEWDRAKADAFSLRVTGLGAKDRIEFFPIPPAGVVPEHPKVSDVAADGARTITFPIGKGAAPNLPWRGVLAVQKDGGKREGWSIAAPVAAVAAAPVDATAPSSGKADGGLLWKLLAAFLGGLIMNVMPCVLPVITLKIFGFVNQAGEDPGRVFRLGLAFNAGVFAFFLGLAALVANLRSAFNWGYQFQNPYLLAGLIALVFVFSLSLLGVFEVTLGGAESKLGALSQREGYSGAFLHGLFTTLLGTSCTAPFLGTSLGFAVTQSAPVIFLLFAAIAAGMSLPYFLLTANPGWMRYLPKPGVWMERAKQIMGFLMLAIAAWLFGVLALRGAPAVAGMSWFLVVLGFAAWLFGLHGGWFSRIAALALPIAGYFFFVHGQLAVPVVKTGEPIAAQIAAARAANRPVFLDFTAEWCLNCKVFEKTVLQTDAVQAKFREKNVAFIVADWTNTEDPEVTPLLKSFGRVGVPLYVLYLPGEEQPLVWDTLTKASLLAELDRVKN